MTTIVTDEQIRQLAESAKPYGLALLWWVTSSRSWRRSSGRRSSCRPAA